MTAVKEYEVRGSVYTQDGRCHPYSTIVKATNSSTARSSAEASARHEYGSDFKRFHYASAHEVR